jgi:hypothetical protein
MRHHVPGCQLVLDGQRAERRLGDQEQREERRDPRQVAAARATAERGNPDADPDDAHQPAEHAVGVLDDRVDVRGRERAAMALGPVRAPEAGARQAHAGTRDHDDHQQPEREPCELRESLRGDREALLHLPAG